MFCHNLTNEQSRNQSIFSDEIKKYFGLQKCLKFSGLLPALTDEDFMVSFTLLYNFFELLMFVEQYFVVAQGTIAHPF